MGAPDVQALFDRCDAKRLPLAKVMMHALPASIQTLRAQFLAAWLRGPQEVVATPSAEPSDWKTTVADAVKDELYCPRDGDEILNELVRMVADASNGVDVRLRASAFMARIANKYAAFHADGEALQ